ncbi:MAG: hypothetical protein HYS15_01515 [Candidatus Spechtbacteria bacterium]|nr:hypothetical protein [Candidatus Spechtbacteria bacterium]
MALFILSMFFLFFIQAVPLYSKVNPLIWWHGTVIVLFEYLIAMPAIFYLIDPDIFFPGDWKLRNERKARRRLERIKKRYEKGDA